MKNVRETFHSDTPSATTVRMRLRAELPVGLPMGFDLDVPLADLMTMDPRDFLYRYWYPWVMNLRAHFAQAEHE